MLLDPFVPVLQECGGPVLDGGVAVAAMATEMEDALGTVSYVHEAKTRDSLLVTDRHTCWNSLLGTFDYPNCSRTPGEGGTRSGRRCWRRSRGLLRRLQSLLLCFDFDAGVLKITLQFAAVVGGGFPESSGRNLATASLEKHNVIHDNGAQGRDFLKSCGVEFVGSTGILSHDDIGLIIGKFHDFAKESVILAKHVETVFCLVRMLGQPKEEGGGGRFVTQLKHSLHECGSVLATPLEFPQGVEHEDEVGPTC